MWRRNSRSPLSSVAIHRAGFFVRSTCRLRSARPLSWLRLLGGSPQDAVPHRCRGRASLQQTQATWQTMRSSRTSASASTRLPSRPFSLTVRPGRRRLGPSVQPMPAVSGVLALQRLDARAPTGHTGPSHHPAVPPVRLSFYTTDFEAMDDMFSLEKNPACPWKS